MNNWVRRLAILPVAFVLSCASDGPSSSNRKTTTTTVVRETRTTVRDTTTHAYVPRFKVLKEKSLKVVILDKRDLPEAEKDNAQAFQLRDKLEEILKTGGFTVDKESKSKIIITLIEDDEKDFCLKLQGQLKSEQFNFVAESSACSSISSSSGALVASHAPPTLNVALNNVLKILDQKSDETDRSSKVSTESGSF